MLPRRSDCVRLPALRERGTIAVGRSRGFGSAAHCRRLGAGEIAIAKAAATRLSISAQGANRHIGRSPCGRRTRHHRPVLNGG